MKLRNLLLTALLIVGSQFCFGQDISIPSSNLLEPKPPLEFKIPSTQPYYVLKADDKSVGIISTYANQFKLNSIEPELISQLEVIRGHNAMDQYGELGANGVIIITFKNYATLSQEIKDMFKDTE